MAARYARTPTARNPGGHGGDAEPALDVLGIDTEKLRSEGRRGMGLHFPLTGDMHPDREFELSERPETHATRRNAVGAGVADAVL